MQNVPVPYVGNFGQSSNGGDDVRLCKIKRLVAESVEVGITLCHRYLGAVGNVKLFDIVNQIIPTAWILNTGYWVYYSNQQGHSLCVCSRFGIVCRHVRNYDHWVDLSSPTDNLPDATSIIFTENASITATNFECNVAAMGYELYNITAKFQVQVRDGVSEIRLADNKYLWFEGRYTISSERYLAAEVFIMFHPNPQAMWCYGKILTDTLVNSAVEDTFVTSNTSKYTFILSPINTQVSYTTIAFPIYYISNQLGKPRMIDVTTQTNDFEEEVSSSESFRRYFTSTNSQYSSFHNQLPPPYPFQKPAEPESSTHRDRFERKFKRGARGVGNNDQSINSHTLAMYFNSAVAFNQPQTSKGRRQKKTSTRRIKTEPKEETVTSGQYECPPLNIPELDLIDEMISKDLSEK